MSAVCVCVWGGGRRKRAPRRRFKNSLHALRTIFREGGVGAFSSGLLPCMLRAFPANAVGFVVYEGVAGSLRGK